MHKLKYIISTIMLIMHKLKYIINIGKLFFANFPVRNIFHFDEDYVLFSCDV